MYHLYDYENEQFQSTATPPRGQGIKIQYNLMSRPVSFGDLYISKQITGFKTCEGNKFITTILETSMNIITSVSH